MSKAVELLIKHRGVIGKVVFGVAAIVGAKLLVNGIAASAREDGQIDVDYTVSEAENSEPIE